PHDTPSAESASVTGGPPLTETTLTCAAPNGPTMKPMDRPSRENDGEIACSVPGRGLPLTWSSGRNHSCGPPSPGPTYTRRLPSGDSAMEVPYWSTNSCPAGVVRPKRATCGGG